MAANRFEIFTRLMGGEQNLPPRLPTPPPKADAKAHGGEIAPDVQYDSDDAHQVVDAFGNLQTVDDFIASEPSPAHSAPSYPNQQARNVSQHASGEGSTSDDFTLDPRKGQQSNLGMSFCPFLAITKFPYKFVDPEFKQPLATAFFDEGKIYNRPWDIYYTWNEQTAKPITFVTVSQAQDLIDEVNAEFESLNWQFDSRHEDEGLLITFDDPNPAYRPYFLGTTINRSQYDFILRSVEPYALQPQMAPPEDRSLEAFKEKMALAIEAAKNKSKKKNKEKHERNVLQRQSMGRQLAQAQRFLGLRAVEHPEGLTDITGLTTASLNVEEPARHPCESDVIIISVDVESYERAHNIITEVGVSTLDTRDLQGTAPGKSGQNWHQFVRARHFRVIEHKGYVNGKFVAGCPEHFEFGKSEWVALKSMPSVLTQCFHEPFSNPAGVSNIEDPQNKRNIVLLGHDIEQDVQYCHKLGFSVLSRGNMFATLDTKAMYQAYTRDPIPRGLGAIMNDFDFAAWHLHNAGNDAVYTIWAMLATCVRDAAERGTAEAAKKLEERMMTKVESATEAAKERAREELEGWDPVDGEGGAAPSKPVMGPEPPQKASVSGHYTVGGAPLDV